MIGILAGILLACVSFVLKTSQVSAIRMLLPGGIANSTVRRHPIQNRYLQEAGKQYYLMKLGGYLFFGTIVGVENRIRDLLLDWFPDRPVRFLIIDLSNVDGVDYSAVEAFSRINRILNGKEVEMILCGFALQGEIGKSLCNVDLFDAKNSAKYSETPNSALEYCENYLLKAFYEQQVNALTESGSGTKFLGNTSSHRLPSLEANHFIDVPAHGQLSPSGEIEVHSPRRHHLHQVATTTLNQQDPAPPRRWQDYAQPLQLILLTFSDFSEKPEEFWYGLVPFFTCRQFAAGSILYGHNDPANGFYLLETGMLKAEYKLKQKKFSELILQGTTCGELPFFSSTKRTSVTSAESDCVTWVLTSENWADLQEKHSEIAQELLKITLKLTSERMNSITK